MRLYCTKTAKRVEVDDKLVSEALKEGLVPSVTQILGIIHPGEHLTKWLIKNSVNHYVENESVNDAIAHRDTTASEFGTVCHDIIDNYLMGKEYDGPCEKAHMTSVEPLKKWIDRNVDSALFTERYFADGELRYGGTADFLLKLKNGELLLGDLKVKKHSYKFPMSPDIGYKYQLSAYRNHFSKEYGEMQIGNFLCANVTNPYGKKPTLISFIYRDQDWTKGFESAKYIWYEKHENEDH